MKNQTITVLLFVIIMASLLFFNILHVEDVSLAELDTTGKLTVVRYNETDNMKPDIF